ncbi:MAG: peptidoglycan editing factor PgeF [Leptothrix sp. (in: Bacteria)]|nr:peptidoglycan editing factor PgeF [Leptothrix sp. (in: b-proteobacteria)]
MSLREGGVSEGLFASLNLGVAVGDDGETVAENRARFAAALGARPVWLRQVHGVEVLRLTAETANAPPGPADAAWTDEPGLACTVQVADCLPVLFALRDGSAVAAAHAGWRGLAAGVLEATVTALCSGTGAAPGDVQAWLGPCIGPRRFEVGADVLAAFGQVPGQVGFGKERRVSALCQEPERADPGYFSYRPRPDGAPRWLADLHGLARGRLAAAGVGAVTATPACTVEDDSAFFSFRRDGLTGRMAAAIWRL